ncbi:hypothetical protein O181_046294 [Austropuccinia psidii MF-1]|uniref:Uncharacterized protein n=1 Tax=Austropuccinia psidii MF-1 TaxID=1389203 RepID=A0A9Q3DNT6_9BASI|nr:hypothetical protein [Austropuccinia psidii MF-1]
MAEISNGYFNFSTGHQGTPFRGFIKAQGETVHGNTCCSFSRDIQETVPKQCVKGQFCTNPPWQPNSFSKVLIHQDLYFPFIHHGNIIQPSSFLNPARYTLHQAVNTALRIQ